jgi:hypothetical protein
VVYLEEEQHKVNIMQSAEVAPVDISSKKEAKKL